MEGRCLCGGVAFEFEGPMTDIELCHCSRCQRASGSAFLADFGVRAENFRWLRGEDQISFYDAPIIRKPPAYRRSFCRNCGSLVPTVLDDVPIIGIPTGVVQGDLGVHAVRHIFVAKKASWWNPSEIAQLPEYEGAPPAEVRTKMFEVLEKK